MDDLEFQHITCHYIIHSCQLVYHDVATIYCSVYGVSTVICLCKTDHVHKINLEMVRKYCYFATTEVSKMSNSWKRNMLYWWYIANTYNILGRVLVWSRLHI